LTVRDCAELASVTNGAKNLEVSCRLFLKSAAATSARSIAIYLLQDSGTYQMAGSAAKGQHQFPDHFALSQIASEDWLKNLFDQGYCKLEPSAILGSIGDSENSINLYQVGIRNGKPAALILMEIVGHEVPGSLHDWSQFTKAGIERWLGDNSSNQEQRLTIRQSKIKGLVLQGFRNSEIASKLSVSSSTVKQELGQIYRLHGVSTRAELSKSLNPLG